MSTYHPPFWLRNGHLQTCLATFRNVAKLAYQRERLELGDGDFLFLDWAERKSDRIVVSLHGLESSGETEYMRGMGLRLIDDGWDYVALNMRSCGGEPNRLLRSYHAGETDDLEFAIQHILGIGRYTGMALVGFSLGGNIALKYAGERSDRIDSRMVAAAAISAPCDLTVCGHRIGRFENRYIESRFLRCLKAKVGEKRSRFPGELNYEGIMAANGIYQFDDRYTAPVHGFESVEDYWYRASARRVAKQIRLPVLLLNAEDDPLLGDGSHLLDEARENPMLEVELTPHGGHVGFLTGKDLDAECYQESRVAQFFTRELSAFEARGEARASCVSS